MARGDAAHVAQTPHGVAFRPDPPAPQTVEQRVAKLEEQVAHLQGVVKGMSSRIDAAKKAEAPKK